ncbi:NAD(P)-linked oxidoreductase superfamily protein [Hibiscus syriacus]|uniref:NAD(P)-linked oxidoreductase superfamily protein n=1 Tax=Hibiscus syriacus TaxID=106335 RepID=A0A6A2YZ46_HIBSY|nr:NAD(P)-linked oxidoreductase superfamily protein [Hibiscus syriacus]
MAEQHQSVQIIPRVKLVGTQGLEVSKLGFGCVGLTGFYNDPVPEDVCISIIKHAFDRGITFIDTSDIYGPKTNEILIGKALKQLPREKVQLATKFGVTKWDATSVVINGTPEYVHACTEASLKRLAVDYIDLYYQHRVDTNTPVEDTMEWSLWTRDIEEQIVPLCRELVIGIVPYSLLVVVSLAAKERWKPSLQIVILFGTTKFKNLDSNIDSLKIKLIKEDLKEISKAVPINEVGGDSLPECFSQSHWKFGGNTPPKGSKVST